MKRFLLLALLACSPALANERAEGEANLVTLSAQVVKAMEAFVPEVDGVRCAPKSELESRVDAAFRPSVQLDCILKDETGDERARFDMSFDSKKAAQQLDNMAATQAAIALGETSSFGLIHLASGDATAVVGAYGLTFVVTPWLAVSVDLDRRNGLGRRDMLVSLAMALLDMDRAALMDQPEVQAYRQAVADQLSLFDSHCPLLAAMMPSGAQKTPDNGGLGGFYNNQPGAMAMIDQAGAPMLVVLTTSSLRVKGLEKTLDKAREAQGGYAGLRYEDRGRVRLVMRDDTMSALIDGRGVLTLKVGGAADGADPVAAMEAVLAQIAVNDFSEF